MPKAQTLLLYGATDTGKTTQLARIAQYLWQTRGWRGRLISGDSGWAPFPPGLIRSPECPDGPIDAFDLASTPRTIECLGGISEGFWPQVTPDPKSGIPTYRLLKTKPEGWAQIRYYLLEGWTAFANLLMAQMVREKRKIAEDVVNPYDVTLPIVDSAEIYRFSAGAPGRAHYKHVQDLLLYNLMPKFKALPVEYVIWTGHEAKGDDDINKNIVVLGPASVGKAIVGRTTENFAFAFHLDKTSSVGKDGALNSEFRAYFSSHPEPTVRGATWPAKVSLDLDITTSLRQRYPGGYIPLWRDGKSQWHGMEEFIQFLESHHIPDYSKSQAPQAPKA